MKFISPMNKQILNGNDTAKKLKGVKLATQISPWGLIWSMKSNKIQYTNNIKMEIKGLKNDDKNKKYKLNWRGDWTPFCFSRTKKELFTMCQLPEWFRFWYD